MAAAADSDGNAALDAAGKVADVLSGGKVGAAPGLASMPADLAAAGQSVSAAANGDMSAVPGALSSTAGVAGDIATVAGNEGVGNVANVVKGGIEIGTGVSQIATAAMAQPPGDGQYGIDPAQTAVNGVNNVVNGVADGASGMPGQAGKVGKALAGGLAVGGALGPVVFGDMPKTGTSTCDPGTAYPTTGNDTVDQSFGVGKYNTPAPYQGGGGNSGAPAQYSTPRPDDGAGGGGGS